jgi:hypothetical protein
LGQRVSLFAKKKNRSRRKFGLSANVQSWSKRINVEGMAAPRGPATENSPLLTEASPRKSAPRMRHQELRRKRLCYCVDCVVSSRRSLSPEEVDQTFGRWPNRLLNYQVFFSYDSHLARFLICVATVVVVANRRSDLLSMP